ncbi:alpha beta hydrolase [Hyphodiscus hymeniophilus]|uniref:Alpha beta hydrolase n=1 Tax=Hyphodiscus hymeniophilus TaxID=353542 RepID=A0A9P6SQ92_9HELO|nr:alpha beta hydrolase [Hyphodiscus hymeniophilus]
MAHDPKLRILEKLHFLYAVIFTAFLAAWTAARHYVFPPDDSPGVARSTYTAIFKSLLSLPRREQKLIMRGSTSRGIERYCALSNVSQTIDDLPLSTKLHWIGPRSSKANVLLYLHGGGYMEGLVPRGHVPLALKFATKATASLAMLEYTLAPEARYPTQLRQAVVALKHILQTTPASRIIIAGDSAGGHLAAVLLSHLNHPSKDIETIKLTERLKGICLISPFLSYDYDKASYRTLAEKDYLTLEHMKFLNENFKPEGLSDVDAIKDPYLSPLDVPKQWWNDSAVSNILLVVGTWEVFLDDCVSFGRRLQDAVVSGTKVDIVQCSKEVHAACVADEVWGLEFDSTKTILAWMSDIAP